MHNNFNTIGQKIGLGFVLLTSILAASVFVTIYLVNDVDNISDQINNISQPSYRTTIQLQANINQSVADIRGWILFQQDTFRVSRSQAWEDNIWPRIAQLENLSQQWEQERNIEVLERLKPLISQLEHLQQQAEVATETDIDSAISILEDELLPVNTEIKFLINELVEIHEDLLFADFSTISSEITLLTRVVWLLLIAGLLISFLLSYFIIKSVTDPIDKAVQVADGIGSGDLQTEVNVGGSRELEVLGNSLSDMRDALQQKRNETELHNWLTNGQNKLGKVIRGDQSIKELADNIIRFITQYTSSDIGALYLINESSEKLNLKGSYAFDSENKINKTFTIGEGLIGQAAANEESIFLKVSDEIDIKIKSAALEMPPKHLMATPFITNGEVLGVIEIGRFEEFTEAQINFIESNLENIGIAMQSAIAREKIQRLLEETQLQSEELQQQHEELEQNNEELEEQTQKLREQQEELQATNEELEEQTQVVEQKNQDLETARTEIELKAKQLEISSKYKSEFLANMSHELRTPLNSLLILANDLLKNKKGNLDEDQIESAEVIANSGRDLLNLINEILDLSKIEAGKMDLNLAHADVQDIAGSLSRRFRKQAEEKGIQLEVEIDESLPETINIDRQRVEQILKNLLSNAIKFTEKGQVTLSFNNLSDDFLSIEVKDTGIGIPREKQQIVFEAFQQAEGGTSRKYGGTGLGLSISRELAKLMNGRITLESEEGIGSTFSLILPMNSEATSKKLPVKKITKPSVNISDKQFVGYPALNDQRDEIREGDNIILIIEDDREFASILAKQAKEKGFKFLAASTGEDGLILAEKYHPTAIILDLKLPGIDGHIVLKELKGNPDLRHIPVHIISSDEKSLEPIKSGAVQYISKPVSKNQLDNAFLRIEDFISRKMKSLLIVEDNKNLRKSIVKLIGNGDVNCIEASTGKEAIEQIQKNTIDCIVLDIGLPDMSGFEFIQKMENDESIATPPIVVYTGQELSKEETEQLQEYAETVIVKGIKSEERLLDETALFLHRTVKNLPREQKNIITSLYDKETLFQDKKILLVDDDMRNIFALSKVLKEKGMKIIKAENGKVALDMLEEHPDVDLVLMDIMMPEMDGYECMKRIRKDDDLKDLPVIALTAKAMKNDRQKCLDAGANDYITKPVDTERLLSLMRIWVKK